MKAKAKESASQRIRSPQTTTATRHISVKPNTTLQRKAKRYILHTDNTINEIAYTLSFNDPSDFVKFFKKAEGLTLVQFRDKYFQ